MISFQTPIECRGPHTIFLLIVGRTERVCPVHARSDRPANIQSVEPSRCTTAREEIAGLGDMSAMTGLVEEIF